MNPGWQKSKKGLETIMKKEKDSQNFEVVVETVAKSPSKNEEEMKSASWTTNGTTQNKNNG